jgi:hypothetical protein
MRTWVGMGFAVWAGAGCLPDPPGRANDAGPLPDGGRRDGGYAECVTSTRITQAADVAVVGDFAFVADVAGRLAVFDVSDPSAPALAGSVATASAALDVAATDGRFAFVAEVGDFETFDTSRPDAMVGLGHIVEDALGVAPYDYFGFSYAVLVGGGMTVVDVSSPDSPTTLRQLSLFNGYDVAVQDGFAYVADQAEGLHVVELGDHPDRPVVASDFDTPGTARDVIVSPPSGSDARLLAWIADGVNGVVAVDVTDAAAPVLVGSSPTRGSAAGVAMQDASLFVADSEAGLTIVDVSDPSAPSVIGGVDTPGIATDVELSGSSAFVADNSGGLAVIDLGCAGF